MIRAFLAVEVPEDLRGRIALIQQDLKASLGRELPRAVRISWVSPTSLHFTIKFLGDLDEQLIDPLRAALAEVLPGVPAVALPLERLGGFPALHAPRVLWVGASERWEQSLEATRLTELHRAVEARCDSCGFAPERRPLSPHLTLARIKAGGREFGRALAASGLLDRPRPLGLLAVESVALIQSDLKPTGAVYTKLWEVRLSV